MSREKEILNASADSFISYGDEFTRAIKMLRVTAFIAGAAWADKHPDISALWHPASEEPRHNELMLGIDSDGVSLYKWCEQEDSWDSFVTITELSKWAYISDLLP